MKHFCPIIKFSHITYVNKLKEVRGLPLPYLIFLGQKDGTGGPVSSSNYCPINGRFTFSSTREDQVGRVGRTRMFQASFGDPVRLNFCKGTKALMTLSSNAIWIFSVFCIYFSFRSESRCAQPKVVRGGR